LADLNGRIGVRIHRCRTYLRKWFPGTPVWIWSALFIVVIFTSNVLSVRFFAETEFWFSFIKVAAIVLFILIGGCAVFGVLPILGYDHAPLFENFVKDGLFPNGWMPVFTTMLTVNFAFSGTELIGVTAGETKDPDKAIPKASHTTLFRLVIFFIGSIVVMASLIPWQDAGVDESPFVLVFNSIGLPFAGDVMNFVVLTAILSAANSGLYASTRMLWSLANEDMIPHNIAKTNSRGVPMTALRLSMIGGLLALLSSVVAASTVYLVLVSVSGLAVVIVWMAIAICQIRFRKQWIASGHTVDELTYRTPGYPIVPWAAFITSLLSCVLIVFDPSRRSALLWMVPFIAACYAVYYGKEFLHKRTAQKEKA
jgi:S-methylmethionine transporter